MLYNHQRGKLLFYSRLDRCNLSLKLKQSSFHFYSYRKKKIIIHIPVKQSHHKHTHTKVKSIHHHHKPLVIKEEKVIKHEIKKPVKIIEDVSHDHFHHHYKHDHPEIVDFAHHIKHPKKVVLSHDSGNYGSGSFGSYSGLDSSGSGLRLGSNEGLDSF